MNIKNKQAGFLELIIFIIIAVVLMSYFNITIRDAVNWIIQAFRNVFP